ncbi:MAG: DUF1638 domain-containing protein [Methanomassiliicoccales archaeon]
MPGNGKILAIVGCRLFEDELVHVLINDEKINEIFIVDNEDSKNLLCKLFKKRIKANITTISENDLSKLKALKGYSVLVWVKSMALHQKPDRLREDILTTLKKLEPFVDAVLLFYGLCGNAFKHIEKDAGDFKIPTIILRDEKGQIVDDCIGCAFGGVEEYFNQLRKSAGTFFLTPMWAANWRILFHKVQILPDPNDVEGAKYIFKCVGYKKVVKIDTSLGDEEEFEKQVDEFSKLFEFERGEIKCVPKIVESSYLMAKRAAIGSIL